MFHRWSVAAAGHMTRQVLANVSIPLLVFELALKLQVFGSKAGREREKFPTPGFVLMGASFCTCSVVV